MPVRYIGRETTYKGKFLFHILCNLKNFGAGRMVVRKSFNERYPEPSYYIINKACPDMTHPELKRGHIIAKQVFRGVNFGDDKKITSVYKHDWELVPKEEEQKYLNNAKRYEPVEAPVYVDMPPLLAKLYTEKLQKQGYEPGPLDTKLWLRINRGTHNRASQSAVKQVLESIPEDERITPKSYKDKVTMMKEIYEGKHLMRQ